MTPVCCSTKFVGQVAVPCDASWAVNLHPNSRVETLHLLSPCENCDHPRCLRALAQVLPRWRKTRGSAICPSTGRSHGAWGAPLSPSRIFSNVSRLSRRNSANSTRRKLIRNRYGRCLRNLPVGTCLPTRIRVSEHGLRAASLMYCDYAHQTRLLRAIN